MRHCMQDCGVGVARSRELLGGVGFLRTLEVGFFHPTPTPDVQFNHLSDRTPKLGILTRAYGNGNNFFWNF